ncbi:hypothetical protein QBC32DRAFT_351063 [Pseudoneurospora amorphoporcata]|uniref:NACHT-NTPase and P-loop NTPases N-terminal domain-containing protein n=1 Tax=Pseudoneurospora amorphoporcata TaxID=241081 RepID=A0AAN6NN37_9PEZI|nr:hypothetical protein QBC32DRAFT_351063 [Pseudoneurospora amorphoporcata]
MSGLEILGAISSVIAILEAGARIIEACQDANGIPSSIRDAHARLPLVIETLRLVDNDVSSGGSDTNRGMEKVLKACKKKAISLERIFRACIPPGASRSSLCRRIVTATRMSLRVGKTKYLMKGILEDIQLLADNRALSDSTRHQIRQSTESMIQGDWRRALPSPLVSKSTVVVPSTYGHTPQHQPSGHQNHHQGTGTQYIYVHGGGILNINSGQNPFIVGTIAGGRFPFPTAANL